MTQRNDADQEANAQSGPERPPPTTNVRTRFARLVRFLLFWLGAICAILLILWECRLLGFSSGVLCAEALLKLPALWLAQWLFQRYCFDEQSFKSSLKNAARGSTCAGLASVWACNVLFAVVGYVLLVRCAAWTQDLPSVGSLVVEVGAPQIIQISTDEQDAGRIRLRTLKIESKRPDQIQPTEYEVSMKWIDKEGAVLKERVINCELRDGVLRGQDSKGQWQNDVHIEIPQEAASRATRIEWKARLCWYLVPGWGWNGNTTPSMTTFDERN